MPTARFCTLIGMPERTWRRWQAKARVDQPPKGPWPQPVREAAKPVIVGHATDHVAWGHRKIWAMTRSLRRAGLGVDGDAGPEGREPVAVRGLPAGTTSARGRA
jgi:hypothetical protein